MPKITPIIVTHFAPRSSYGELSPPSCGIVEETIHSMRTDLGISHSNSDKPILIYNHPRDGETTESQEYKDNLKKLADRCTLDLHVIPNNGLRDALLYALERVDTELVLFLEHDWVFTQKIPIDEIISVIGADSKINYIRFNKMKNRSYGRDWDTIVKPDKSRSVPLCRVSSFSNNPHIAVKVPYEKWVKNSEPDLAHLLRGIRRNKGGYRIRDLYRIAKEMVFTNKPQIRGWNTVEYVIDTKYKQKIRDKGFEQAHTEMGTYLYGDKNEGPFVRHLGS